MELIGEIGTNHNGNFDTAIKLIDMAASVGLDTVKFQVYDADDIVSPLVRTDLYGIHNKYEFWKDFINDKLITPKSWLPELVSHARDLGMDAIATAHSMSNAEACLKADIRRLKIASMDCNYYSFLEDLCSLRVPILLSTGMSTIDEIYKSVHILKRNNIPLTLFHCVATYPTRYEEANMSFLQLLRDFEPDHLGFSDHSPNNDLIMMAVPFGVDVIEKHITLDKTQDGPDHPFALDPADCLLWREKADNAASSLGTKDKQLSFRELENRKKYRRVAISLADMEVGDTVDQSSVCFARPPKIEEDYIDSETLSSVVGMRLSHALKAGEGLTYSHLKP